MKEVEVSLAQEYFDDMKSTGVIKQYEADEKGVEF